LDTGKHTASPKRSNTRIAWHKLDDPKIAAEFKEKTVKNSRNYSRREPPHPKPSQRPS
jgi:hypothetical protein